MGDGKSDVLQGTLDLMVLKTLELMGSLHGYAIARRIEQVSDHTVIMNQGTIYPALLRLQQRKWRRVLAYGVAQQTRESAIRMALGASRGVVLLGTLRYALIVATAGVAGGLIVSIGLTRFLSSLLYGVKPLDWVTMAAAILVLFGCCALAAFYPA